MILALSLCGSASAQHQPQACHVGELWTTRYPTALYPDGSFVHIPQGITVVLNTTTVYLGGLLVEGDLVFDHSVPTGTVHLRTAYAVVTGSLQVGCHLGSNLVRFTKKAHITLISPERYSGPSLWMATAGVNWPTMMENKFGGMSGMHVKEAAFDRGLIIAGSGRMEIYGADKGAAWTTLAASVAPGATLLSTDSAMGGWSTNDELILASTDFEYPDPLHLASREENYGQGEPLTIAGFGSGANEVVVAPALQHGHYAATETYSFPGGVQDTMTMKAELGNLTRSVVIQGEYSDYSSQHRTGGMDTDHLGHVALMEFEGTRPSCKVEWVELRDLGVEAKLGRYPFHFHELPNYVNPPAESAMSYIKHCAIHRCVNRFVAVHDTQHVVVEGNVGYDTLSTGFFLEDDIERLGSGEPDPEQIWETQNVVLRSNLVLAVEAQTASVDLPNEYVSDLDSVNVSGFWIGHPNQKVEGNHSAGTRGHGFTIAPGKKVSWTHGAAESSYFRNNVAHSNGQHGFYHQSRAPWAYDENADPPHRPAGEGLVAWKNRRYGIWWRTYGVSLLSGCKVADNKSGIYPASEGRQNAYGGNLQPATCSLTIADSLIVGFSANVGERLNPAEAVIGGAGRSLPQTYFKFARPDGGEAHEKEWDTINALEAYDGRNRFVNLRIANFPDSMTLPDPEGFGASALLRIAAITQVEYNSRYAEDPRNSLELMGGNDWAFTGVTNRLLLRDTSPLDGFSMIRNTVIHDAAGILGYPSGKTVTYNDGFFAANREPGTSPVVDTGRNLQIFEAADEDFAQIEIAVGSWATGTVPNKLQVGVRDTNGTLFSQVLAKMPASELATWAFNAPLGVHDDDPQTDQTGIYYVNFLANTPKKYDIKIQFCSNADIPTILALPFSGTPGTVVVEANPSTIPLVEKFTLGELLVPLAPPHAYFHDSSAGIVYVRTTTALFWGGTADAGGTRNVLHIQ